MLHVKLNRKVNKLRSADISIGHEREKWIHSSARVNKLSHLKKDPPNRKFIEHFEIQNNQSTESAECDKALSHDCNEAVCSIILTKIEVIQNCRFFI